MKTCSKCGCSKSFGEFSLLPLGRAGRRNSCKDCRGVEERERRERNSEEISRKNREKYLANPQPKRASAAKRRKEKPEECRAAVRNWNKNNPAYEMERYRGTPNFRLSKILRRRLLHALSKKAKSAPTLELLGCPVVWLEVHLESLFKPGMSWENHGPVWHIDHKKPCAAFDLTDPEQQRICFHWTNLQPLFALDNLRKSDKYAQSPEPQNSRMV